MSSMKASIITIFVITCFTFIACSESVPGPYDKTKFIKFTEDGPSSGRLETAIVTYKNSEGRRVDLIAAVHLADPSYYFYLGRRFETYDALLYELIAPHDEVPDRSKSKDADSLLSFFQRTLCKTMQLAFQLDAIDYTKPNFVHADLTVKEFAKLWRDKGESIWKILFRVMTVQLQAQQDGVESGMTPDALMAALFHKDSASRLKFLLAKEFKNIELLLAGLESGKEGEESVILGERNKACLRVLKEQLKEGKKRLAIFYGGGHMPDIERRLQRDFGFKKTAENWICAWDIKSTGDE